MKFEVLSHLVLRLVVGSFLLFHSILSFGIIPVNLAKRSYYVSAHSFLDNILFQTAAPLFPYLECMVSLCVLIGIWRRGSLILSLLMITLIATYHFILGQIEVLSIIAFVLGGLVAVLFYFKQDTDLVVLDNAQKSETRVQLK